jgi:hypothetical protein
MVEQFWEGFQLTLAVGAVFLPASVIVSFFKRAVA